MNNSTSTWMANLTSALQLLPLTQLAIPGTHDSGSFALDEFGPMAPDHSGIIIILAQLLPFVSRPLIKRWSQTQALNITQQLQAGIRYLDVRVGEKPVPDANRYFFVHGLYGVEVIELMQDVDAFLRQNPREVVLTDLNHFYGMDDDDHVRLVQSIVATFGALRLVPYHLHGDLVPSLQTCYNNGWQVLIFYQFFDQKLHPAHAHLFWPHKAIASPWPNTANTTTLLDKLTHNYYRHQEQQDLTSSQFYVSQGLITPDLAFVVDHLFDSLLELTVSVTTAVLQWCETSISRVNNTFNIVIADAVDPATNDFGRRISQINFGKAV